MSNILLGSGVIGCLARRILDKSWDWIPFKRSRYYSFDVPYADNFIVYDKAISDFMADLSPGTPLLYKRSFSFQGALMCQELPILIDPYLNKIYGEDVPQLANKLLKTIFTVFPATVQNVYHRLEDSYRDTDINRGVMKYGDIVSIDTDKKTISCTNGVFEFDNLLSTIPLDALVKLCGKSPDLKSRAVCYYYLITDVVDLEGAEQALVVDSDIEFFKVQMLKKHHYVFWTFNALERPLQYFGQYLNFRVDIIEAKRIDGAIPIGQKPDLGELEKKGVWCVGSNAQWCDQMDISSSIKRLLRVASSLSH